MCFGSLQSKAVRASLQGNAEQNATLLNLQCDIRSSFRNTKQMDMKLFDLYSYRHCELLTVQQTFTPSHITLTITTTGFVSYRFRNLKLRWYLNVNISEHSLFGGAVNRSSHSRTVWTLHIEIHSTMTDQDVVLVLQLLQLLQISTVSDCHYCGCSSCLLNGDRQQVNKCHRNDQWDAGTTTHTCVSSVHSAVLTKHSQATNCQIRDLQIMYDWLKIFKIN